MAELSSKYDPSASEGKWYDYWMEQGLFRAEAEEGRESYTVVIPPPNVTGVLHMGHMLNNTIQDVLIRKARMEGKNACWVPGTDHASIATEAKVVAKLKEEGIRKWDLTREQFLEHAWAWTEKHGGIIQSQLKRLGVSCDWDREAFTLDEIRSESVIRVFVDLYRKGKIYRGHRMVHWDPEAKTTVSDEEVIHKAVQQKLYYVRYNLASGDGSVTIATTRPETILGDTAICVHPEDERFQNLIGQRAIVPLTDREIPIIGDSYVDREFGTGCLKVTPAHDVNDYEIGKRHELETIDVLNADGTLNEHGLRFEGMDRFAARKAVARELEEKGQLIQVEDYATSVGTSERTGAVIEPRLSVQWFLAMKELAEPATEAVRSGEVRLIPDKFKNTYFHWMENVRDWNISRQLYWGHRIPAWYYGTGKDDFVVALDEAEAVELARQQTGRTDLQAADLRQDDDVLDTWFSSWLWPISVFDGIRHPDNPDMRHFYPTKTLVTAPEILFFWVARMIIAGYEFAGQKPFDAVYLTGIVRDKQGRKMSKSLGNSPDPIGLMDQYGADGVRVGMLVTSPAGNDLPFDESLCEQGRNFCNKLWNALRLVKGWEVDDSIEQPEAASLAHTWFHSRLSEVLRQLEEQFAQFRISEALMTMYRFAWDDFCAWYLEMVKPAYQQPIDAQTYEQCLQAFEQVVKLAHPFLPFLTEEIWHQLRERDANDSIMRASWPEASASEESVLRAFSLCQEVLTEIRTFRQAKNVPNKEALTLLVREHEPVDRRFDTVLRKLGNLETIEYVAEDAEGAYGFRAGKNQYFLPVEEEVDVEAERARITTELDYARGFLEAVRKKLSNDRFVNHAPAPVVEKERKKQEDAEAKIRTLEEQLARLN